MGELGNSPPAQLLGVVMMTVLAGLCRVDWVGFGFWCPPMGGHDIYFFARSPVRAGREVANARPARPFAMSRIATSWHISSAYPKWPRRV